MADEQKVYTIDKTDKIYRTKSGSKNEYDLMLEGLGSMGYSVVDEDTGARYNISPFCGSWYYLKEKTCLICKEDKSIVFANIDDIPDKYKKQIVEYKYKNVFEDKIGSIVKIQCGDIKFVVGVDGKYVKLSSKPNGTGYQTYDIKSVSLIDDSELVAVDGIVDGYMAFTKHDEPIGIIGGFVEGYENKVVFVDGYARLAKDIKVPPAKEHHFKVGDYIKTNNHGVRKVLDIGTNYVVIDNYCYTRIKLPIDDYEAISAKNPPEINRGSIHIDKEKLTDECYDIFVEHGYEYTRRYAIKTIIDEWSAQKASLYDILRKHPKWSEKDLAIIDKIRVEYSSDERTRRIAFGRFYEKRNTVLPDELYYPIRDCAECGFASQTLVDIIKEYNGKHGTAIRCMRNQKITKVIRDVYEKLNRKDAGFEKDFAILSDAFVDGVREENIALSINPVDYLLMSNGQYSDGSGWSSCHYLDWRNDSKCYQAGTQSYMTDRVTMIMFTFHDEEDTEIRYRRKVSRQVWCYGNEVLLQSRLYPNYSDYNYAKQVREYVVGAFDVVLDNVGEDRKCWEIKNYTEDYDYDDCIGSCYFKGHPDGNHYEDYTYSDYDAKLIILNRPKYTFELGGNCMTIGSPKICVECGSTIYDEDETGTMYCYDCDRKAEDHRAYDEDDEDDDDYYEEDEEEDY